MTRPGIRRLLWVGGLLAALAMLRAAATGDLSTPPLTSLDRLGAWADDRGPVASTMGLVRLMAEGAVWYLLGLTALHAAATGFGFQRGRVLADALGRPAVSRLVRTGLGITMVATVAEAAPPPAGAGVAHGAAAPGRPHEEPATGTAWMTPLPADEEPPAAPPAAPAAPGPAGPTTHRVEQGESLWTIAEEALELAWHRPPSDREIDPYWRTLVEANRHRLVDDDPDLILPGQVLELPAVPPPG